MNPSENQSDHPSVNPENSSETSPDQRSASSTEAPNTGADPRPTRLAGQMNFPDSMPHAANEGGVLINGHGEPVPPMRQNGQAGSNEITWLAGKPIVEQTEPEK